MTRYNKFLVIKNDDIETYLSDDQQILLSQLAAKVRVGRIEDGKSDKSYVCVAENWPMYEDVWTSIEAFVDGRPSELESLRTQLAESQAKLQEAERLRFGLENCRLLAARHRKEDWALLILGFCAEAGVVGSVTR